MKKPSFKFIPDGTVTSPIGFVAGATAAGIKKAKGALDLGVLFSEEPCVTAGVFTSVKIKSSPVMLCQQHLKKGLATAIIANAGCANAYMGEQGMADAREMAAIAAKALGIGEDEVLVASTGVTGKPLPINLVREGVTNIVLTPDGGHTLAHAIMTTDTMPKEAAVTIELENSKVTLGAVAKGSGMIHPNMGTMFCFLATDAALDPAFARSALKKAADISFNMITVDGDTSPSDTFTLMANGKAGNEPIVSGSPDASVFQEALNAISIHIAKMLARDGEGATRMIEVNVRGAASIADAKLAARTIAGSSLVKTAVHGGDPNWGRILAAAARSGCEIDVNKVSLSIGDIEVFRNGLPVDYRESDVAEVFKQTEVPVSLDLKLGRGSATSWGCDLSAKYVQINAEYMT